MVRESTPPRLEVDCHFCHSALSSRALSQTADIQTLCMAVCAKPRRAPEMFCMELDSAARNSVGWNMSGLAGGIEISERQREPAVTSQRNRRQPGREAARAQEPRRVFSPIISKSWRVANFSAHHLHTDRRTTSVNSQLTDLGRLMPDQHTLFLTTPGSSVPQAVRPHAGA